MPNLNFIISTAAELAGAKETEAALERQIGKAKALKQDYSGLSAQLATVRESLQSAKAPIDETTESVHLFSGQMGEARRITSQLTRIAPELGEAFRALRHPIGGTIGAAITVFVALKAHIAAVNAELDALAATAAQADFLPGIEAKLNVFARARDALQEYIDKEGNLGKAEANIANALQSQLQLMAAIEAARSEQTKAQKALEEAKISQAETSGKITPSQAIAQKAAVEKKYIQLEADQKKAAQEAQLAAQAEALKKAEAQQKTLREKKVSADDKVTEIEARRAHDENDFGDQAYQKKLSDLTKQQDEAIEARDKMVKTRATSREGFGFGPSPGEIAQSQDKVEKAAAALKQLQEGRSRFLAPETPEARNAFQKLKDEAKLADLEANQNLAEIGRLRRAVPEAAAKAAATAPIIAGTTATQVEITGVKAETELEKQAKKDVESVRKYVETENVSPETMRGALDAIKDLLSIVDSHNELIRYVKSQGIKISRLETLGDNLQVEVNRAQATADRH